MVNKGQLYSWRGPSCQQRLLRSAEGVWRETCMIDRCVRKDSMSCDPTISPEIAGRDAVGIITSAVRPHAPVNHTLYLCHGFIIYMYINKILMKTRLYFWHYVLIRNQSVLDFLSGSELFHLVWMFPLGLDFPSGSGYEDLMANIPCYIMWSTQNQCITVLFTVLSCINMRNF